MLIYRETSKDNWGLDMVRIPFFIIYIFSLSISLYFRYIYVLEVPRKTLSAPLPESAPPLYSRGKEPHHQPQDPNALTFDPAGCFLLLLLYIFFFN